MTPEDHGQARYRVGCAGQFMMGMDSGFNDLDAALVYAEQTPGSFVYGPRGEGDECFGPFDQEQADEAKARIAAREASHDR
jgi:hypothetical protein